MSDLLIFAIGLLVFFITVYGTVMAGGLDLTRRQLRDQPTRADKVDDESLESTLMTDVEY